MRMNKELAKNILNWINFEGAVIVEIYEDSFKAIFKNEYRLCEINVQLNYCNEKITENNVFSNIEVAIHTLERY